MVQFVIVGEELSQVIPPPLLAAFPIIVQFVIVGEEKIQYIPLPE